MQKMKGLIWLLFCLAAAASVQAQGKVLTDINTDSLKKEAAKQKKDNKKKTANTQFIYFVTKAESGTYGYDIYADGRQYIHQPTIPGMGGTKGFTDTASAGRTAGLVIKKIRDGESPPTVTLEELRRLKVIANAP